MIAYQELYLSFIAAQGVGSNDLVADSRKTYVSYLNSVSKLTGKDITPRSLRSEDDIVRLVSQLKGKCADKTISNYRSAMRRYVEMVRAKAL